MGRPRPLHREVHPDLNELGCFACRISTVGVSKRKLQADRMNGMTQSERLREIRETAERDGREIQTATRWV